MYYALIIKLPYTYLLIHSRDAARDQTDSDTDTDTEFTIHMGC